MERIQGFDQGIWHWLQERHSSGLDVALTIISSLANPLLLTLLAAAVAVVLIRRRRHDLALLLLASLAGGQTVISYVPDMVGRERPQPRVPLPDVPLLESSEFQPHLPIRPQWGYPSQFTVMATVTLLALALIIGELAEGWWVRVRMLAIMLIVLVGFSRMYWGVCYPTDVVGAWLVGTAWVLFCWWGYQKVRPVSHSLHGTNATPSLQQPAG